MIQWTNQIGLPVVLEAFLANKLKDDWRYSFQKNNASGHAKDVTSLHYLKGEVKIEKSVQTTGE
jgi:hypothetical protein